MPVQVGDKAMARVAPMESCFAIGVLRKYKRELDQRRQHVVLVNPMNMGNLGTIVRTMAGFGLKDLGIIRPAADVFDARVVRSSMGAIGRLGFQYFNSFDHYRAAFDRPLYPFVVSDQATRLHTVTFDEPFTLVFGNESTGLGKEFASVGTGVTIQHSDQIDSLNLAIAVGIGLYEATKDEDPR